MALVESCSPLSASDLYWNKLLLAPALAGPDGSTRHVLGQILAINFTSLASRLSPSFAPPSRGTEATFCGRPLLAFYFVRLSEQAFSTPYFEKYFEKEDNYIKFHQLFARELEAET